MAISELLRWQWSDYSTKHQSKANLLIHIFAVPLFMTGCLLVMGGWVRGWWLVALGFVAMMLALVFEGVGHRYEPVSPDPFKSPLDFLLRFFLEQWVTFPRYVISGGWWKSLVK